LCNRAFFGVSDQCLESVSSLCEIRFLRQVQIGSCIQAVIARFPQLQCVFLSPLSRQQTGKGVHRGRRIGVIMTENPAANP